MKESDILVGMKVWIIKPDPSKTKACWIPDMDKYTGKEVTVAWLSSSKRNFEILEDSKTNLWKTEWAIVTNPINNPNASIIVNPKPLGNIPVGNIFYQREIGKLFKNVNTTCSCSCSARELLISGHTKACGRKAPIDKW